MLPLERLTLYNLVPERVWCNLWAKKMYFCKCLVQESAIVAFLIGVAGVGYLNYFCIVIVLGAVAIVLIPCLYRCCCVVVVVDNDVKTM